MSVRPLFDPYELSDLIEYLTDVPGMISAALVEGPRYGDALIDEIRARLSLPVEIAPWLSPNELGQKGLELGKKNGVWIIPLDGRHAFQTKEEAQTFWRGLNFQRERLASGLIRTCFLLTIS